MTIDRGLALATKRRVRLWRRCLPGLLGVAVVVGGSLAWGVINFGSLYHAWLYAGGVRVTIQPRLVTVQEGKAGDVREAVFSISNLTDQPVRVVGVTTSCTCVSYEKLPIVLPPKGTKEMHVSFQLLTPSNGISVQSVVFHTNHPAAPNLAVSVARRALEP
jgi:hypothetical protein